MSQYVVVLCINFCIFCSTASLVCQDWDDERELKPATAIRAIIILIVAWGIVLLRGEAKSIGSLARHNLLFLVSGMATGFSWIFYFKAFHIGKESHVAPVDKLSVALTIILSVIFLNEALTIKTAIGAAIIIAGTLIMIL